MSFAISSAELGILGVKRLEDIRKNPEDEEKPKGVSCLLRIVPKPILQNGPQCGLIALRMILDVLEPSEGISVDQLFEIARDKGFTTRGEMFSANWLADLALSVTHLAAEPLPFPDATTLVRELERGALWAFCYDCDKNHEPVHKNGLMAHWAVAMGYAIVSPDGEGEQWFSPSENGGNSAETLPDLENRLYLFCRHGKTKQIGVWQYAKIRSNNAQLNEWGQPEMITPPPERNELRGIAVLLKSGPEKK